MNKRAKQRSAQKGDIALQEGKVYSVTNKSMLDTLPEHQWVNSIQFFPKVNLRGRQIKQGTRM